MCVCHWPVTRANALPRQRDRRVRFARIKSPQTYAFACSRCTGGAGSVYVLTYSSTKCMNWWCVFAALVLILQCGHVLREGYSLIAVLQIADYCSCYYGAARKKPANDFMNTRINERKRVTIEPRTTNYAVLLYHTKRKKRCKLHAIYLLCGRARTRSISNAVCNCKQTECRAALLSNAARRRVAVARTQPANAKDRIDRTSTIVGVLLLSSACSL